MAAAVAATGSSATMWLHGSCSQEVPRSIASHRSDLAREVLRHFAALYDVERQAREQKLDADNAPYA